MTQKRDDYEIASYRVAHEHAGSVQLAEELELASDGTGTKQHKPILKPDRIPQEQLRRATAVLMGAILIVKRVSEALFFSSPFF